MTTLLQDEMQKQQNKKTKDRNLNEALKLINNGEDIETTDDFNSTTLMLASSWGLTDVVQQLIAKGANVDATDNDGYTALMCASSGEHTKTALTLIAKGAKINHISRLGNYTALMCASQYGRTEIALALIDAGADIEVTSYQDKTALMLATPNGYCSDTNALTKIVAAINQATLERSSEWHEAIKASDAVVLDPVISILQSFFSPPKNTSSTAEESKSAHP
jgi:ankyrin repeat protein